MALGFNVNSILSKFEEIKIAVLFGFAGSLSNNLRIGDFTVVESVKLICDKKPLFNPIKLLSFDFPKVKNTDLVSILDGYEADSVFLSNFADVVDKESYFFAKAVKESNILGVIFRVISDNNNKESVLRVASLFSYDVDFLDNFVQTIGKIESDSLKFEIFKHTGISDLSVLSGLSNLINKKRLTFSQRQNMYRKIRINKSFNRERTKITTVFIEKGVKKDRISFDLSSKKVYEIDDYVGCFHNLKDKRAVVFANKKGEFLRKTPDNYTPDNTRGYSILNAYNCLYDCSYCFLKGYFKSFNPVVFLNYEDYFKAISDILKKDPRRPIYFYAGTFSDSLLFGKFSDFNVKLAQFFSKQDKDVYVEFRTKSDYIEDFLNIKPKDNIIIAFSLNPQEVIDRYEAFTPSLSRRLEAVKKLSMRGFRIGIRFDPVFLGYVNEYRDLMYSIKDIENIHSVEIGFLRFDKKNYFNMLHKEPNVLSRLVYENGMYRYKKQQRQKMVDMFKKYMHFYISMEL